jgi:hypothetical protein
MIQKIIKPLFILTIAIGCSNQNEMKNIDLQELSVSEIHQAYKSGSYNSEELVTTYLERIEILNSDLNAISYINPEAITIAKALDEEFKKTGVLRPLHGIPLIVKDNFNTKGMPTTAGSMALKDFIPEGDAFLIQKLVEAGEKNITTLAGDKNGVLNGIDGVLEDGARYEITIREVK